jgi:hypothetical protein
VRSAVLTGEFRSDLALRGNVSQISLSKALVDSRHYSDTQDAHRSRSSRLVTSWSSRPSEILLPRLDLWSSDLLTVWASCSVVPRAITFVFPPTKNSPLLIIRYDVLMSNLNLTFFLYTLYV